MKTRTITTRHTSESGGESDKSESRGPSKWTVFSAIIIVAMTIAAVTCGWWGKAIWDKGHQPPPLNCSPCPECSPLPLFVPTSTPEPMPTVTLYPPLYMQGVMLGTVWLWSGPDGEILSAGLLAGTEVEVLKTQGDQGSEWYLVRYEAGESSLTGWVTSQWVRVLEVGGGEE